MSTESTPAPSLHTVEMEKDDVFLNVTYSEADFIGRGELGAIYRGQAERHDGTTQDVVVKVPHSVDRYTNVLEEYATLSEINEKLRGVVGEVPPITPVPEVGLGYQSPATVVENAPSDESSRPILVMPYYKDEHLLIDKVRGLLLFGETGKILAAEKLAVIAAIGFAQVMQALHRGDKACMDRKIKDFYLVDDDRKNIENAPVVIDWNVLQQDSDNVRVREIRLFGTLWHELFLSRKANPPLQPFVDALWQPLATRNGFVTGGAVSVGFRLMLSQAVEFQPQHNASDGTAYFKALELALRSWLAALNGEIIDDSSLLNVLTVWPQFLDPLDRESVRAALVDLQWRLPGMGVTDEARAEAMQAARAAHVSAIDLARQDILNKRDAREALAEVEELIKRHPTEDESRAHLERWKMLLTIYDKVANSLPSSRRRGVQQAVMRAGELLHVPVTQDERADLEEAYQALENLATEEPEVDENALKLVQLEIRIRRGIKDLQAAFDDSPAQRASIYEDIKEDVAAVLPGKTAGERVADAEASPAESVFPDDEPADGAPRHYMLIGHENDLSILSKLLPNMVDQELREAIDDLPDQIDREPGVEQVGEIRTLVRLAHALKELDELGVHLRVVAQPVLDTASYIEYFYPVDLEKSGEAFAVADTLENGWFNGGDDPVMSKLHGVVQQLRARYLDAVAVKVEQAVQPPVRWQSFSAAMPYVDALERYGFVKRVDMARIDDLHGFYEEWFRTLVQLIEKRDTQSIEQVLKLLDLGQKKGVDMTDLLGSKLVQEHRQLLENQIDNELLKSINNLRASFEQVLKTIDDGQTGLQDKLKRYDDRLKAFTALVEETRDELGVKQDQMQESAKLLDIRLALDNFDLKAVRELIDPELLPDEMKKTYAALSELRRPSDIVMTKARQHLQLVNEDLLKRLSEMRDLLRTGLLPEDGNIPGAEKFFTDADIVREAQNNSVLRGVIDLYWTVRTRKAHGGLQDRESQSVVIANSFEESQRIRKALRQMQAMFEAGQMNGVEEKLAEISQRETLTDELVQQVLFGWRARVTAYRRFKSELERIVNKFSQISVTGLKRNEVRESVQKMRFLLLEMVDLMKDAPADIMTPQLVKSWQSAFRNQIEAFQDVSRQKSKDATVSELRDLVNDVYQEAMRIASEKQADYAEIFK